MGCQTRVTISDLLTFAICTHDPDTGELTDTDSSPIYRIYEDEIATPILTGTMEKLDGANTTGFYTERIECSLANGFEDRKSYTIYIEATVDGIMGGITFAFVVRIEIVVVALTLRSRGTSLTLRLRSTNLTLEEHSTSLTLKKHSTNLTLRSRSTVLTLPSR